MIVYSGKVFAGDTTRSSGEIGTNGVTIGDVDFLVDLKEKKLDLRKNYYVWILHGAAFSTAEDVYALSDYNPVWEWTEPGRLKIATATSRSSDSFEYRAEDKDLLEELALYHGYPVTLVISEEEEIDITDLAKPVGYVEVGN